MSAPSFELAWAFWVSHYGGFPGFLKQGKQIHAPLVEPYVSLLVLGPSAQPYSIVGDELAVIQTAPNVLPHAVVDTFLR